MNAHSRIEHETLVNMTSKGQVLIPKVIRDKMGLCPNGPVRVGIDEGGVFVRPVVDRANETPEQRKARLLAALESLSGKYANGQTTDEYMRWLRGDWEP